MADTKACLFSYVFDGAGGGAATEYSAITANDSRFVWMHLNGRHADTKKILKEQMRLDSMVVKSLLAEETRPRIEETQGGILVILRGINFNPGPTPEDLVSIRLWINQDRIISVGRRKSKAVADMDDRILQGKAPKKTGEFIAMLSTSLNDGIEAALLELEGKLDRLEEISLDAPDTGLRNDLAEVRKQATLFRRHAAPQRDVTGRLQKLDQPWMSPADKWLMQDNADRLLRFIEDLDAARERAQILQDEIYSALSSRLNRNLNILSIITVIFMPLTFLTGLLGMNVAGIPHAQNPLSFGIVCLASILIALVQIIIFRRLKWF